MKAHEIIDEYFKNKQEGYKLTETEAKELFNLIEKGQER